MVSSQVGLNTEHATKPAEEARIPGSGHAQTQLLRMVERTAREMQVKRKPAMYTNVQVRLKQSLTDISKTKLPYDLKMNLSKTVSYLYKYIYMNNKKLLILILS